MLVESTYIHSYEFYRKIIDDHEEDVDSSVNTIINNIGIYKECKGLANIFKPVSESIDVLQRETTHLAECVAEWCKLLTSPDLTSVKGLIKTRVEETMTPYHFIAYMLRPKYMGEGLCEKYVEQGRNELSGYQSFIS